MGTGTLALAQSCIISTKTLRDVHEGTKLATRLDDARTEALLRETGPKEIGLKEAGRG